jgi:AmmeMemoRadiSam system protein A
MDKKTINVITSLDPKEFLAKMESGQGEACGDGAVLTTLIFMKNLGARPTLLRYANSGDTAGPKDRVVGYAAIAFTIPKELTKTAEKKKEANEKANEMESHKIKKDSFLTDEDRKTLLLMARKTLEEYLSTGKIPKFPEYPSLKKEYGMFVTLRKGGQLRGCIGYIVPRGPLYEAVTQLAISSACHDPRFRPVTKEELPQITIEISVMSPLHRVKDASEVQLGLHGVVVKRGFRTGVFLPQVATETGWSKEEFLSELCSQKAGLPPDAWKDPQTELLIFTCDVFDEEEYR